MGRKRKIRNFNQNDGVPGVVYIIKNSAFKKKWVKIGCSRRSGAVRAEELNRGASTGIPAEFKCLWECKTKDCGRAEKAVHSVLESFRRGKPGQEWFKVEVDHAKLVIEKECELQDQPAAEESLSGPPARNPNEFRQGASAAAQDAKVDEAKRLKAQLESKDKSLESSEKNVDKIASRLSSPKPPKKKGGCRRALLLGAIILLFLFALIQIRLFMSHSSDRRSGLIDTPRNQKLEAVTQEELDNPANAPPAPPTPKPDAWKRY